MSVSYTFVRSTLSVLPDGEIACILCHITADYSVPFSGESAQTIALFDKALFKYN